MAPSENKTKILFRCGFCRLVWLLGRRLVRESCRGSFDCAQDDSFAVSFGLTGIAVLGIVWVQKAELTADM